MRRALGAHSDFYEKLINENDDKWDDAEAVIIDYGSIDATFTNILVKP